MPNSQLDADCWPCRTTCASDSLPLIRFINRTRCPTKIGCGATTKHPDELMSVVRASTVRDFPSSIHWIAMGTREFTRVPNLTCLPSSALIQPQMIADPTKAAARPRSDGRATLARQGRWKEFVASASLERKLKESIHNLPPRPNRATAPCA